MVDARWAHITKPQQIHLDRVGVNARQRDLCMRGCPFRWIF